ncbi:phosphopantothenoylcysteine decarboxylase, partial [Stenotrophomonas maltophilia]|uniref:phosphopantothenoylcysteine decarboxylase domain-containing protein n=1 Tax=Stenotrophomonas maltophilia TaxID=40324 RepID=UPI0023BB1319
MGRLTGADSGAGRLPEPAEIWERAQAAAAAGAPRRPRASGSDAEPTPGPLAGRTVVITAGGTREALDPVRY